MDREKQLIPDSKGSIEGKWEVKEIHTSLYRDFTANTTKIQFIFEDILGLNAEQTILMLTSLTSPLTTEWKVSDFLVKIKDTQVHTNPILLNFLKTKEQQPDIIIVQIEVSPFVLEPLELMKKLTNYFYLQFSLLVGYGQSIYYKNWGTREELDRLLDEEIRHDVEEDLAREKQYENEWDDEEEEEE